MDSVDSVFLLVANGPAETHQGLVALSLILDAAIDRIVYLSSDLALRAPLVPHAGSKLGIEAALRASGAAYTILRPTYFAQNDLIARDALEAGVYPFPTGSLPLARVDTRDVATAAARALLDGKGRRKTVLLSGPDKPNGEETAALWSAALGRTVTYREQTPEDWAASVAGLLPPWLIFDLTVMYRHLQDAGHPIDGPVLADQRELLPQGPRGYRDFLAETAKAWSANVRR
ncbi:MAG: SDR family oxidoreductase [Rhodospirillales bacterium]